VTAAESSEHSDRARAAFLDALVHDDPVALYDSAPCGFLTTTPDGLIVKTNATFRTWVQREASELVGELTFSDLLTVGGKVYYGTHVGPMLQMSGQVQEIALDLVCPEGDPLPVLVNATLARGDDGLPRAIRIAVFDATERRSYERELLDAKHRAEASEREARALARTLQQTLIPPSPPAIPGLDVATAYQPAGHGTEVGGDFYDVFRVGDDWVIALGDVCGKGPEAAVVTSLVRHTVRALCVGEPRPSAVLSALGEVLRQHSTDRFCTAVLARLTPEGESWRVTLGVGGHPHPLLLRSGHPPEPCGTTGPLLGVVDHATYADTVLRLDPGDALLLYTDGITEGRRGGELYGDDRLLATAGRLGPDPAGLVDVLVRELLEFQDGTLRDDVAVVAFGPPA
jgi:sigma-B regulation protein RsbU (phosphoserine phosphatase)